jgi:hypothetical protein
MAKEKSLLILTGILSGYFSLILAASALLFSVHKINNLFAYYKIKLIKSPTKKKYFFYQDHVLV